MRCKKTFDARTLSHQVLEQLRRSAVQRVEAGESPEFVAAGLGLNRRTIYPLADRLSHRRDGGPASQTYPGRPTQVDRRTDGQTGAYRA